MQGDLLADICADIGHRAADRIVVLAQAGRFDRVVQQRHEMIQPAGDRKHALPDARLIQLDHILDLPGDLCIVFPVDQDAVVMVDILAQLVGIGPIDVHVGKLQPVGLGVIVVRLLAVKKDQLPRPGLIVLTLIVQAEYACIDIEQQKRRIAFPLDIVVLIAIVMSAPNRIIEHGACLRTRREGDTDGLRQNSDFIIPHMNKTPSLNDTCICQACPSVRHMISNLFLSYRILPKYAREKQFLSISACAL